jgi:hypothetical protein
MTISSDQYWSEVSSDSRCVRFDESRCSDEVASHTVDQQLCINLKKEIHLDQPSVRPKIKTLRKNIKIEEIIISSSDESSVDESEVSDHDSSPDDGYNWRKLRTWSDRRAIVTPPIYKNEGEITLQEYLTTFENYFEMALNDI